MPDFDKLATVKTTPEGLCLFLQGNWIASDIDRIDINLQKLIPTISDLGSIDATNIARMDTAGAFLFQIFSQTLLEKFPSLKITGLNPNCVSLVRLVEREIQKIQSITIEKVRHSWLYRIGERTITLLTNLSDFFGFFGEVFLSFLEHIAKPLRFQWKSMIHEIELGGYQALPIIAVMMCLIGVVLAYQLGVQLEVYGADQYIVDLSGVAIFREFSPLISSVIIAGRTSTSFAALIGTMKVNEEIDVLRTMGLSPIERLVLPKITALVIALPLLVVWGDIFGVLGSMVMAKSMIGITYKGFLARLKQEVAMKHLFLGLVKTPVFALIIAGVGCFQGFQAERSAESVGIRTTKAAVQSIFLIILADSLFSILFNWMNL